MTGAPFCACYDTWSSVASESSISQVGPNRHPAYPYAHSAFSLNSGQWWRHWTNGFSGHKVGMGNTLMYLSTVEQPRESHEDNQKWQTIHRCIWRMLGVFGSSWVVVMDACLQAFMWPTHERRWKKGMKCVVGTCCQNPFTFWFSRGGIQIWLQSKGRFPLRHRSGHRATVSMAWNLSSSVALRRQSPSVQWVFCPTNLKSWALQPQPPPLSLFSLIIFFYFRGVWVVVVGAIGRCVGDIKPWEATELSLPRIQWWWWWQFSSLQWGHTDKAGKGFLILIMVETRLYTHRESDAPWEL